jgi:hypothetical protein
MQEYSSESAVGHVSFREPMLNVRTKDFTGGAASSYLGYNGGGGTDALRLSVGAGLAKIGVEIRSRQHAGTSNLAAVGASIGTLPAPGIDVLGAHLLLAPLPMLSSAIAAWSGAVTPKVFTYSFTPEGVFLGPLVGVPAAAAGADLYLQGFVLDLGTGVAVNTNVWHTAFFP